MQDRRRHSRFFCCLVILSCLFSIIYSNRLSAESKELSKFHEILGKSSSVQFFDYHSGKTLFSHQEQVPLIPASTLKLVTTWQALEELGAEFKFITDISFDQKTKTLYLKGGLDPLMTTERLWLLARGVRARGVTSIKKIVIDESALEDGARDALSNRAYDTAVTAFPISFNSLIVTACATNLQKDIAAVFSEPPIVPIKNGVRISRGSGFDIAIDQNNALSVYGKIDRNTCQVATRALSDPELGAKKSVEWAFKSAGFSDFTVSRGVTSSSLSVLWEYESLELRKLLTEMNHFSSNHIAQATTCRLGGEERFSCRRGAQKLEHAAQSFFGDKKEATIVDGSGLSRDNALSARILGTIIKKLLKDPRYAVDFEASLPTAGQRGTVKKRNFGDMVIHAKSGSLNGVSSLAGIIYPKDGRRIIFSIIMNNTDLERAFDVQERLIRAVVSE